MESSKYGMPPPTNRVEFEHNLALIIESALEKMENSQFDPGFVHMTLPSLKKLLFLPNGRINLNSVDESLRLQGNMQNWMEFLP